MLTHTQEKLILSLHHKNGRKKSQLCLVEGEKNVLAAKEYIEFTFTPDDSPKFEKLVTTTTPQHIAAVARIPEFSHDMIAKKKTILLLDGIQDPGNIGSILRLASAFDAGVYLVECADVTSPKVIRSAAGASFHTLWAKLEKNECIEYIKTCETHALFRLEKRAHAQDISIIKNTENAIIIAGSEGNGIHLNIEGTSVAIPQQKEMESLNVGNALAIALYQRYNMPGTMS